MSAKNRKTRKGESSNAHRRAHRGTGVAKRRRERAERHNRTKGEE